MQLATCCGHLYGHLRVIAVHCADCTIAHQSWSCIFYVCHSTELSHSIQIVINRQYFILIHVLIFEPWIKTKNYTILNYWMFTKYSNCIFILFLITLMMPAWVAETCRWLVCNMVTFICLSAFFSSYKHFIYLLVHRTGIYQIR